MTQSLSSNSNKWRSILGCTVSLLIVSLFLFCLTFLFPSYSSSSHQFWSKLINHLNVSYLHHHNYPYRNRNKIKIKASPPSTSPPFSSSPSSSSSFPSSSADADSADVFSYLSHPSCRLLYGESEDESPNNEDIDDTTDSDSHSDNDIYSDSVSESIGGTSLTKYQVRAWRRLQTCWAQGEWLADRSRRPLYSKFLGEPWAMCDNRSTWLYGDIHWQDSLSSNPDSVSNAEVSRQYRWCPLGDTCYKRLGGDNVLRGTGVKKPCRCSSPFLDPPSRLEFCRVIRGRNILVIGDSINNQLHDQLYSALAGPSSPPVAILDQFNCSSHIICGELSYDNDTEDDNTIGYDDDTDADTETDADDDSDDIINSTSMNDDSGVRSVISPSRLKFIRNDHLLRTDTLIEDNDNNVQLRPVDDEIARKPEILIVNRGAHWVDDSVYLDQLNASMRWFRNQLPNSLIIFRTTVPGHPDCVSHSVPLSSHVYDDSSGRYRDAEWSDYFSSFSPHPHHWDTFMRQNKLASFVVSSPGINGVMMDVAASTQYRSDSHRIPKDCLHYCSPGPIDTWISHLYSMLRVLNKPNIMREVQGG